LDYPLRFGNTSIASITSSW